MSVGMDTITHGLTGAVIGYCGFRQRGGRAVLWTAIVAAEFPDIDILLAPLGSETYFRWHRSFTHSALLLPFWAALVTGAIWLIAGRKNFRLLFAASAAGTASHLALDWMTNYGTMLLWPLSDTRFALSWVFILDTYVWAMLGVALWAMIRARQPAAAPVGLAIISAYILMCGESHWDALRAAAKPPGTQKLAAFAQPMKPFRWTIIRGEADRIHWINGNDNETFIQFHDDKLLPKAEAMSAVKLFRWFAEFPLAEKLEENGHTVLRYRDLRFRTPMPWGRVSEGMFVVATVVFDEKGTVLESKLTGERE
jgi:membrane-bound metal-dependent hydrolase YbcI (DUF457 family)